MATIEERIQDIIGSSPVVLFMKGTAQFPLCGFSGAAVTMLKNLNIAFKTVNVLDDPDIREGIKVFSQWPTIPQLYVKGEFIGGADIMKDMYQSGELAVLLAA